jgi:hypothetical protein
MYAHYLCRDFTASGAQLPSGTDARSAEPKHAYSTPSSEYGMGEPRGYSGSSSSSIANGSARYGDSQKPLYQTQPPTSSWIMDSPYAQQPSAAYQPGYAYPAPSYASEGNPYSAASYSPAGAYPSPQQYPILGFGGPSHRFIDLIIYQYILKPSLIAAPLPTDSLRLSCRLHTTLRHHHTRRTPVDQSPSSSMIKFRSLLCLFMRI